MLRLLNLKRGDYVVTNLGIGKVTSSKFNYVYVRLNDKKVKIHYKQIKKYYGFVGAEYQI